MQSFSGFSGRFMYGIQKQPFQFISDSYNKIASSRSSHLFSTLIPSFKQGTGAAGTIVVTGIGKKEDDEFLLTLLNEQNVWDSIILATDNVADTKKRFLSRTARYSGLLNVLDFVLLENLSNSTEIEHLFSSMNPTAWLAFNVTQDNIPIITKAALSAGVKRAIFTIELPLNRINDTVIPEFDEAIQKFSNQGGFFTGIRHGRIIEGNEDNSYEIVNSTIPLLEETVERGVLARVAAELLRIEDSFNQTCGVCSSSAFALAYLNILRSSGLTRNQEVRKVFGGGIQRVARLTVQEYQAKEQKNKEKLESIEKAKEEEELQLARARNASSLVKSKPSPSSLDDEENMLAFDEEVLFSDEELLMTRTKEILQSVWIEYDMRMFTKSTSKKEFFANNMEKAKELATQELQVKKEKDVQIQLEKQAQELMIDRVTDVARKQYSKLLSLEKKEMQNQKDISDVWMKYIYILLENTMKDCKNNNILFHNLDEFEQTLLLRKKANELRHEFGLPHYEVIYDSLDASVIVDKVMKDSDKVTSLGLVGANGVLTGEEVGEILSSKYGQELRSISALRGAAQIIEWAIETLKKELPKAPPTVTQLRQSESAGKQLATSQLRLDQTKNRGKPFSDGPGVVEKI
eukprot:gene12491-16757_t